MQKRFGSAILAFALMFSFNSCVREYTCQCKINFSGAPGLPNSLVNEYIIKDSKENAAKLCEAASSSFTDADSGITTTENCKLF